MNRDIIGERIAEIRSNQKKTEEILMQELEKNNAQLTSETSIISEVAHALIELWKVMELY